MRLRTRLFVTSVVVVVPLALALMWLADRDRYSSMERALRQALDEQVSRGGVAACEAFPEGFARGGRGLSGRPDRGGGPGRDGRGNPPDGRGRGGPAGLPTEVFVYGPDFTPVDPRAPQLSAALRRGLSTAESARSTYTSQEGPGLEVAIRFGSSESPCAFLMGRMPPRPGELRDQRVALGLVVVSVLAVAWIAAVPVISRMRRLAAGVQESAASRYERPVTLGGSTRDEIAELADAFNAAGASVRQHLIDIEARQEALRQFVANTTHDVAMPLTVLQGHLSELERTAVPNSPEHLHVRESIQEAHYLASLVRNLGAAARLDAGVAAIERRPVDLGALVERVVARHRALARARSVTLDYAVPEDPVTAVADLTLLEQAVSNLADNAVQYNGAGGHVAIVLDRHGTDRFLITVRDDGPGVTDAELADLTARRFRGSEARTRRPDGQGLGLAIVAEAVARNEFRLTFRKPDEGGFCAEIEGPTEAPR